MKNQQFPLVTIGIPTYNRADGYLRETLESALAQSYPNLEILVADNCSTDNTKLVVESYKDKRVRYFRHETGLIPNDNFNFCLSQARGYYFLLLHNMIVRFATQARRVVSPDLSFHTRNNNYGFNYAIGGTTLYESITIRG